MDENSTNKDVRGTQENLTPKGENTLVPTRTHIIEPFFHPQPVRTPSLEYVKFMEVRQKILNVIRNESQEKKKVLDDIVDTLLEYDRDIPTDILSSLLALLKLGKKVREERKKRELYRRVASSILEQIFDPLLEFKLTKKDILDTFEANDMEREKVSNQQINQIYVKVLHKLKVGKLRDLTLEQLLHQYVRLKLEEINFSRQDWELNGR